MYIERIEYYICNICKRTFKTKEEADAHDECMKNVVYKHQIEEVGKDAD